MRESDDDMIIAAVVAMREKLEENQTKPDITSLSLDDALEYMRGELWELTEEIQTPVRNYERIRRELGDVLNFAGAAVHACDRELGK